MFTSGGGPSLGDHKPDDAWAVFPDRPEKKFTDFDEVIGEALGANEELLFSCRLVAAIGFHVILCLSEWFLLGPQGN